MATTVFLWVAARAPTTTLFVLAALILATVVAWVGLFESRRWALPCDLARLALAVVGAVWLAHGSSVLPLIVGAVAVVAVASAAWLLVRPEMRPGSSGDAVGAFGLH